MFAPQANETEALAVSEALAVLPVPNSVVVSAPLTLLYVPATGAMTLTLTEQLEFAANEPPLNVRLVSPAAGLKVGAPQSLVAPGGLATIICPGATGSVSVKEMFVNAVKGLGLVMVKVKTLAPPAKIGSGENDLARLGGAATVSVSFAAVLFEPPEVVNPPTGMVLTCAPTDEDVTATVTVQLPLAGMVPPLRLTLPAALEIIPLQEPPGAAAVVTTPAGSVSVKAALVKL